MIDKRSNQVSLPFDFEGKDVGLYVRQHWNATFSRQRKVSVLSKKIMSAVMSQIKKDDDDFKGYYQFHISNFITGGQTDTNIYSETKKAFKELTDLKWLFEDLEGKRFAYRALLNTSDVRCGYDNGTITVVLNPLLKPFFIALAHYTIYELKWYMTFSNWYSMRLYELLSAYKDTGFWIVDVAEYRKLMDCENKYKKKDGTYNDSDMIKKTIGNSILELEPTDMAFTVEAIKEKQIGVRGRKSFVRLVFRLKKIQQKNVPSDFKSNPRDNEFFEKMHLKYQISEANIVKYYNAITPKGVVDLLKSWDLKEKTDSPIKDKLKYCNSVFVAMGKKAIETKEKGS
jgi:plasmid replication initiation protein